jgi:hypothetical protein
VSYKGVRAVHTLAEAKGTKVYLWYGKGRDHKVLECELYDELSKKAPDKFQPDLHLCCPECGGELNIEGGQHKDIKVWYLDKPRPFQMEDNGEIVYQTAVISVEEVCRCSWPDPAGKGRCKWSFVIQENRVYRV